MDKNFSVRMVVGAGMFVVALITMYTFDGVPFKILFGLFILVAIIELLSFFKKKFNKLNLCLVALEFFFLIGGVIFINKTSLEYLWYIILGVCGYDVFAYLFGKLLGRKFLKKARPFPSVSKNKTWEGTISGLIFAIGSVALVITTRGAWGTDWVYLFCGLLALIGDLFESFLKRQFKVKDSNEILIKNKFFEKLELIVGGSEGHGGFLDRADSGVFAMSMLLILSSII